MAAAIYTITATVVLVSIAIILLYYQIVELLFCIVSQQNNLKSIITTTKNPHLHLQ